MQSKYCLIDGTGEFMKKIGGNSEDFYFCDSADYICVTKGYHPVFEIDKTCMLHYALQLKQKGMIKESEERMKKLIANLDYHLFDLNVKNVFFRNLLHLSVELFNRLPGGLNENLLKYLEILKIVLPGTIINRECHNELIGKLF